MKGYINLYGNVIVDVEAFKENPGLALSRFVRQVNALKNAKLKRVVRAGSDNSGDEEGSEDHENHMVDLVNFRGSWLTEPFNWSEVSRFDDT